MLAVRGNGAIEYLVGSEPYQYGPGVWREWVAPGEALSFQDGLPVSYAVEFPKAAEDFVLVGAGNRTKTCGTRPREDGSTSTVCYFSGNAVDPVTPEKLGWEKETVRIYVAYTFDEEPGVFYYSPNPITVHVF